MGNISASSQQLLVEIQRSRSLGRNGDSGDETDCVDLFTCYDRNKSHFLEKEEGDRFFADLVELAMPDTPIQARKAAIERCWDEFDNNPKDQKLGLDELEVAIRQCFEPQVCLVRGLFSTKFVKYSARDFLNLVGFNQIALVKEVLNDKISEYADAFYLTSLPPLHLAAFLGHSQLMDILWPRVDLWRVGVHPVDQSGSNFSIFHCVCLSPLPDASRLSLFQQIMSFFTHPSPSSLIENYPSSACSSSSSSSCASSSPDPSSFGLLSPLSSSYPLSTNISCLSPSSLAFASSSSCYPLSAFSSSAAPENKQLIRTITTRLFIPSSHSNSNFTGSPLELLCCTQSSLCLQYLLENFVFAPWEIVKAVFRAAAAMRRENAEALLKYIFTPTPLNQILGPPTSMDTAQSVLAYANSVLATALSDPERLPFARMLLQAFVNPVEVVDSGLDLQRMLCGSAHYGAHAIPAAKLLFEFLADPNTSSPTTPTVKPMDEAGRLYNFHLISLLIEYGGDFSNIPNRSHPGITRAISAGLEKVRAKMEVILECTPLKEVWLVSIVIEYVFGNALAPLNSQ